MQISGHTVGYSLTTISTNSPKLIFPSPSLSAYWIICWIYASVNLYPTYSQTLVNSSTPKAPCPFLSNTWNNCCRDFSLLVSVENPNISRNMGKSIYYPSV